MRKVNLFSLSLLLLTTVLFISCEDAQKNSTVSFTVLSCTPSWSPENDAPYLPATGAEIKIYKGDRLTTTVVSNENGTAIVDLEAGDYNFLVSKGNEKNITSSGYLITGIFSSLDDIYSSPMQEGAVPGGLKFSDLNNDAIIDAQDRVSFASFSVEDNTSIKVYIAPDDFTTGILSAITH